MTTTTPTTTQPPVNLFCTQRGTRAIGSSDRVGDNCCDFQWNRVVVAVVVGVVVAISTPGMQIPWCFLTHAHRACALAERTERTWQERTRGRVASARAGARVCPARKASFVFVEVWSCRLGLVYALHCHRCTECCRAANVQHFAAWTTCSENWPPNQKRMKRCQVRKTYLA